MRRIISLFVVLMLFSSLALAEEAFEFDFTQYSLDELITIRHMIEEEINGRVNTASATLYPGNYVAGVDIAAGSYILSHIAGTDPDNDVVRIEYYGSISDMENGDYIEYEYLDDDNQTWRISLSDGMVLKIAWWNCTIQQAPPMLFAPEG